MSLKHRTHVEYGRDIGPRLTQFIQSQRDSEFEAALGDAFSFYSFIFEDFRAEADRHQDIFDKIGVMLVELQDVFRGLLLGQAALSPVVLAALTRVALEVRINLKLILSREAPGEWADRYMRFASVSTLAHDNGKPQGERRLRQAEVEKTLRECAEWVQKREDGSVTFNFNWTADKRFDSVKRIAGEVGLLSDYENTYAVTSEYVHGTYLLMNAYRGPEGVRSVGQLPACKMMTFLGMSHCMYALHDAAQFFGVPLDDETFVLVRYRVREACRELLVATPKQDSGR